MPARLSPAQLAVLKSAADGNVKRQVGYPYRWYSDGWLVPRSATCKGLLSRSLMELDFDGADARFIPAVVTDAGQAVLDRIGA